MRRIDERGETLVEVVMALGILSLVLVSSYALATGTFRLGRGAGERTQAVNYLQQQAEALRTYRNTSDWRFVFATNMNYYTGTDGAFCMKQVTNKWQPVKFSQQDCKIDNITVTIHPTPIGLQQYNFDLKATWKTASQDNNATLTTTLTDQTP